MITEKDFTDLGFALNLEISPFYEYVKVFKMDGQKQSPNMSDGYDVFYEIEEETNGKCPTGRYRIKRIDVGGFGGGEHPEQIFYGTIPDNKSLITLLKLLSIPIK